MNYKEKYKEALERAKSFQEKYGGDYAGYIFPELAESEDERIRRWLCDYFSSIDKAWIHKDITCIDILRWLEKQKEQKEELVYRLNGLMQDYIKEGKDDEEKEHRLKCYQLFWDALEDTNFFEQKEQKPAEWSEEDERIRKAILGFVNPDKGGTKYSSYAELVDWSNWLKSLRPSWKPSEDELAKKHLDGYCMGREDTLREMKDFVESHFNCENAKKGTPIVYNTQSGTSTLKAEG